MTETPPTAPERHVSRSWRTSIVRRPVFSLGVAVLVIGAGVGTGVVVTDSSPSSGGSSPAAAVQQLLTAADHSDALGALDVLDPGERAAVEPGTSNLISELQRLNVLSSSASLSKVNGLSLQFSNVTTSTSYLTSSLAVVTLTGGSYKTTTTLSNLPLGSFVKTHAGAALSGTKTSSGTAATGHSGIATVKVDGSWYISLGDTIAVNALRASGASGAPPRDGVTPTGAATPTAVVTNFLEAVANFDLRSVIASFAPEEMGALQQYAPDFLPRATAALARASRHVRVTISDLHLSTTAVGDGTLVKVDSMDLTATAGNDSATYKQGCLTLTEGGKTTERCANRSQSTVPTALRPVVAELQPIVGRFRANPPQLGIMTVRENGSYFVSPLRTLFQNVNAFLAVLQPNDLNTVARAYAQLRNALLGAVSNESI